MEIVRWFFFELLILGYVEDPATGLSFHFPAGLSWALYTEVYSSIMEVILMLIKVCVPNRYLQELLGKHLLISLSGLKRRCQLWLSWELQSILIQEMVTTLMKMFSWCANT